MCIFFFIIIYSNNFYFNFRSAWVNMNAILRLIIYHAIKIAICSMFILVSICFNYSNLYIINITINFELNILINFIYLNWYLMRSMILWGIYLKWIQINLYFKNCWQVIKWLKLIKSIYGFVEGIFGGYLDWMYRPCVAVWPPISSLLFYLPHHRSYYPTQPLRIEFVTDPSSEIAIPDVPRPLHHCPSPRVFHPLFPLFSRVVIAGTTVAILRNIVVIPHSFHLFIAHISSPASKYFFSIVFIAKIITKNLYPFINHN